MSNVSPNPYESPQSELGKIHHEHLNVQVKPNYKAWWIFAFCLNLPLCGFLGFIVCDVYGRVGMCMTVIAFLIATTWAFGRVHLAYGSVIGGAIVVALLQFIPIYHAMLAYVALWIATLGKHNVQNAPLGFFQAVVVTLIIAGGLLFAVIVLGTLFAIFFDKRSPSQFGRSEFGIDSDERGPPADFRSSI